MERKANNCDVAVKGFATKGQAFFAQRWLELFNEKTLDTYQYNVLNACGALEELEQVLSEVRLGTTSMSNLEDCRKETLELVDSDPVLKNQARHVYGQILHHLGGRIKDTTQASSESGSSSSSAQQVREAASINRLSYQLHYALTAISLEYTGWLLDSLRAVIDTEDFDAIDKVASSLGSECIRVGWSAIALHQTVADAIGPFDVFWDGFRDRLSSPERAFDCVFLLGNQARLTQAGAIDPLKMSGLEFVTSSELPSRYKGVDLPPPKQGSMYVVHSVKAKDVFSAAYKAIDIVDEKLNVLAFFRMMEPWTASSSILVVDGLTKECVPVSPSVINEVWHDVDSTWYATAQKVTSSGFPHAVLKLHGLFLYFKLSQLSPSQEVKFLNLWVALESFLQTGQYGTAIEHVKEIAPPLLCTRYIYRLFRNFAEDCNRCEAPIKKADGSYIDFEQPSKAAMVAEVIAVVTDSNLVQGLMMDCSVNSLLVHRLGQLSAMVKDGQTISELLTRHCTKVRWHLQRLYRVRNAIAHSAHSSERPILTYIRNLREYLSVLVSEVVYRLDSGRYGDIEEVLAALVDNYFAAEETLGRGCTYDKDLWKDGILNLI